MGRGSVEGIHVVGFVLKTHDSQPTTHNPRPMSGEVAEWLMAHAWKACIRLERIEGSNPSLSVFRVMGRASWVVGRRV